MTRKTRRLPRPGAFTIHNYLSCFVADYHSSYRAEEKEFIESQESTVSGGTTWERIAKLVDLSEKNARTAKVDKTRFRELLLSLKSDPNAPGAKGY